ncbi:sodium:proton antiporter [Myxosarcina sp. GI1]|uniref:cation:proton antiporter n=1 Tax=Myxosarcina sp. GI1 TaxID=1541065 RepID=UPI00055DE36B|nr:cation:proton antiporter [Myxosarcina sp. GI1]
MLFSIALILLLGFISGQLMHKLGAPPLIGAILTGIIIGPELGNFIAPVVLDTAADWRSLAVMVILMRAGLGLDRDKLVKQGSVAIRLGFLPALTEGIIIAIAAMFLFNFDLLTGLLLGSVVGAESPAVIVPGMLRLKSLGWGVAKGIPDVILTGSALSDVLVLLLFSLLLNFLTGGTASNNSVWLLPLQVILQIILGIAIGWAIALIIIWVTTKKRWTQNVVQKTLIVATLAILIIVLAQKLPYSGYLATMAMGFFIIELDPPLARQLRTEFNHLWVAAEIILFVLMGASIELEVLEATLVKGILLLAIGLFCGRTIGWYLSTLGSNWNWRERLFLLPGNSAKATVQAAIGAIPLSQGVAGGEIILAIAAWSILITAPIGAWAIPTFAPQLLTKDAVDPTKVNVASRAVFLAAIDGSDTTNKVLTTAADLARRSNGEIVVLFINNGNHPWRYAERNRDLPHLKKLTANLLLDIRYQFITVSNVNNKTILDLAYKHQAINILVGKPQPESSSSVAIHNLLPDLVFSSSIPITFI